MTGYVFADTVNGANQLSGRSLRLLVGALLPKTAARLLGGLSGVSVGTPNLVTASSSTWTVKAHTGVLDVSAATDGPTPYAFDQNVTGAMTAADQNNPRIDLICVTHNDSNENDNSTTSPQPVITYVAGVAAASPNAPATPARSLTLAQISVPKLNNGNPSVQFVAPYAVAAGGILPCSDNSEYPASPYLGQYVDDATIGLMRWNGSAWKVVAMADPAWIALPTAAGVTNNGAAQAPQYRVWPNGKVELRGAVVRTNGTNFTSGAVLFDLPAGASPAAAVRFSPPGSVNTAVTVNPRLDITPDGVCTLYANTGDYQFVAFDGMYFYTS